MEARDRLQGIGYIQGTYGVHVDFRVHTAGTYIWGAYKL